MSNIIPRKEFAEQCGIANNAMPVYIARGKLIMNGTRCSKCEGNKKPCKECSDREYVDLNYRSPEGQYINLDFYKKWAKKEPVPKQVKKVEVKEKPEVVFIKPVVLGQEDESLFDEEITEQSSDAVLTRAKKYHEIQNKKSATRLNELKEAQMRGDMIPVEIVKNIIQFLGENQKRAFLDATESIVMLVVERLSAQEHDKAFIRTGMLSIINKAISQSVNESQEKLDQFIPDELQENTS